MSRMLYKMNLISIVQQLPKEDIETIQSYIEMIEEENQELKEQLKDKIEDYKRMKDNFDSKVDVLTEIDAQRKEFIKYLEDKINFYKINTQGYSMDLFEEILQQYKRITGVSDDNKTTI